MNLDKLKEAARKFEQREDWRRAIEVYLQAIREAEAASGETTQDPGLYNRIGDLQLKAGDLLSALRAYEEAAELYADQGFFNNAIALCGKILRINPNRIPTYLRLAQLHARKNFVGEARKNLGEYLGRMGGPKQRGEAFAAIELFAGQFSANPEIRAMLVELLRETSSEDEDADFGRLAAQLGEGGGLPSPRHSRRRGAGQGRGGEAEHLGRGVAFHNDLIFLDTGPGSLGSPERDEPIDELRTPGSESLAAHRADPARDATPHGAAALDVGVAARESAIYHQDIQEGPDFDILAEEAAPPPSELITADSAGPRAASGSVAPPENVQPLEAALAHLESEGRWGEALEVAAELTRIDPNSVLRYQKQVELAYYSGERSVLIQAYLELADALSSKDGPAREQAAHVYRRVLVHEPENQTALAGLAALTAPPAQPTPLSAPPPESASPTAPVAPASAGFVDLAALILDETSGPSRRDTRIRVGEKPQDEDEERVFREALADFKRGVDSSLDPDDFQAHYDLGIAYKEMGLMEEAVAQFQKALRAPEGRLKAAEQLGITFYEQGQYGIAEVVLRRANGLEGPDDEKIGILYWFGRTLEAEGKLAEALPLYEQAVALDIRFLDVRDRVQRLTGELGR